MTFLVGAFLAAHGLIHASYLSPSPRTAGGPDWPFTLTDSWLVTSAHLDAGLVRALGVALVTTTVILFVGAGLATVGWLVPHAWWASLVVGGAVASLATIALFFHPWLVLGLAIDLVLFWAVVVNGWEVGGVGA